MADTTKTTSADALGLDAQAEMLKQNVVPIMSGTN